MISIWYYAIDKFATNIKQKRGRLFALRLIERVERYQNCKFCKKFFTDETVFNVYDSVYSFPLKFFVTGDVKLLLENLPKKKLQVSFRHHEPSLYAQDHWRSFPIWEKPSHLTLMKEELQTYVLCYCYCLLAVYLALVIR